MENRFFEDIYIGDVSTISGIRPGGRTVDHSLNGRRDSCVLFVWNGEAVFRDGESSPITVGCGDLLFIPKGKKYRMEYTAPETTFVLVNFNTYKRSGEDALLMNDITLLGRDDEQNTVARIMTSFELCSTSENLPAILRKRELLYRLLGTVWGAPVQEAEYKRASRIAEGVILLEQNYIDSIPISRFAEACHVSENTFRLLFHKQYKTSPVQYRNRLRIARARELLTEGSCTVSEAAWATGFENVGYFCRLYKRITGENPSLTKRKTDVN